MLFYAGTADAGTMLERRDKRRGDSAVFDIYFEVSGEKCQVTAVYLWIDSLPLSHLLDQRRILFWNRTMRAVLLHT